MYMLVAKAEAGRTMPHAWTMYLRVMSIKERSIKIIKERKER